MRGNGLEIEEWLCLGEAKEISIGDPIAVPPNVPTFDQEAIEPALGNKVDITNRFFSCGS